MNQSSVLVLGAPESFPSSHPLASSQWHVTDLPMRERIHQIWDALADFDAAQVDVALAYLQQALCDLIGAQNADWFGVVRLPDSLPKDAVHGWRPHTVHFLHPSEQLLATILDQRRKLEKGIVNEVVVRMVALSGQFRACRLGELVPESWFQSDFYQEYYRECGHDDAIYTAFPINEDVESYFGIFRAIGQPPFTRQERDILAYAHRGIKWFHRRLLLSHGLLIAGGALTQVERRVLGYLLTSLSEKQIAAEMGQSYHTTHEHVANIYRKFGVNNRAALMALWLGKCECLP